MKKISLNFIVSLVSLCIIILAFFTTSYLKNDLHISEVEMGEQSESADKYTILLPTYNEIDNLPIVIWLINKYMEER